MPPKPPTSPPKPSLGTRLRDARKARGLTLAALADAVDAAPSYLSMIENGRVDNPPSAALLARLEAALRLPDAPLQRAAAWQTTPPAVRAEVARLADEAERGRNFAVWLAAQTDTNPKTTTKAPRRKRTVGKDLDALYRSGQLAKRLNAVLRTDSDAHADEDTPKHTKTPNARKTPGVDSPPSPPEASERPLSLRLREAPRVPLINRVAAGDPSAFTDLGFPAGVADDYLAVPGLTDPDAFATRIDGASMNPDYDQGDLVVFSPLADVTDGCDAFVRLEPEHEVTFKRVYFDEAAGTVRLQPLNPDFAPRVVPRESVAGCFRAVWRFAKL